LKVKYNKLPLYSNPKIYIGNDIVSLNDINNIKSFKNQKYLRKFLNTNELLYLEHPLLKDFIPPLFWSCKESAIKILLQKNYKYGFAPSLFEVKISQINTQAGNILHQIISTVNYGKYRMYCKSEISHEYISSFACNKKTPLKDVICAIEKTNLKEHEKISKQAYLILKKSISSHYKISKTRIDIIKDDNGKPQLFYKDTTLNIPFSISHDEKFISFAFLKTN